MPTRPAPPQIAVTVDDLPAHATLPAGVTRLAIARRFIAALRAARVPQPTGFVNGASAAREPEAAAVLPLWRRAGFPLGNHGWAHRNLDDIGPAAFAEELVRDEPVLAPLGGDWRWFRYPFVAEGKQVATREAARAILNTHGYRIAAVTMSFNDWAWNDPYARCVARGDRGAIAALERGYLAAAATEAARARSMSQRLYGRDIPYVLLLHIGAFDATMLPRLLALYRRLGFGFTTLARAEADPVYRADLDPGQPWRPSPLEGQLAARGQPVPAGFDPASLDRVCR